jgi:glycogen synthase
MNIGQYLTHNFDLWMVMSHLHSRLALNIEFEWIKGHHTPSEEIPNGTGILLNIDVDRLAIAQYTKQIMSPQRGVFLAGTVCFHQNGHHVQDIYNAISSRETDKDLLDYYVLKGWKMDVLEGVDWIALGKFLKRHHPIERCKIV